MLIFYIFLTSFILFSNMFSGTYLIINAIFGKLLNSSIVSTIFNLFLIASLILSLTMFKSLTFLFFLIFIFYNLYSLINYFLIRKDLKKYNFRFDFAGWIKLLQKSYIFVLISFFSGLYSKLDVFLLQFFKGSKDVGIYSAGYSFFEALIFIAASYNIARTPIFSKLVKTNVSLFLKKIKKDFFYLLLLGILIVIFTELFGPLILPLFIKGNYLESINVVKIVIFTLPLILLNSIFLNVLYVLKRAKLVIYVFLFQTTVNFILNFLFIPRYSYIASSYITVFAELLNVIILFLLVLRYFPRYENSS